MSELTEVRTADGIILSFDGRVAEVFDLSDACWRAHVAMLGIDRGEWGKDGRRRRVVLRKVDRAKKNVHVTADEWPEVERFLEVLIAAGATVG
ncbi:MAG TPA: hypothetical protein VF549_21940 [Solirubrobacteraceae bacterium]|jgi:hypothetical protein